MRRLSVLIVAVLMMVMPAHAGKLNIVTTVGMIGDLVSEVAGNRADVSTLIGEGVDPHSYRTTRSDVILLGRADVIIHNGLYLEAQMEELLHKLAKKKPVIALGETLPKEQLFASDEYPDKFDPHIWMSPALWKEAAENARDELIRLDPEGESEFRKNAAAYITRLDALSDYVKRSALSVPENSRVLVTAHDAFGYFGKAYGFEVLGIQGISTQSEAGLLRIEELVNLLVERRVSAVFVESSVSERNIRALVEGAAARGHKVIVGGELFSDAMGAPGTYEGTYIGMLDHNATVISRALGGNAPARGLNNRLGAGS
ncbi:metal ABC transporter solute-binding protein, Zn/Mn family [Coralliovum pocilloporae]|uniref:metal ABC transporter solute-binding protein, Zn/Mn family n=1 Tax=Coralliovum pocilloporae TaxID=3066369 RepID=UPI003307BD6A